MEERSYLLKKRSLLLNLQKQFANAGYKNIDHALDFAILAICEEIQKINESRE